MIMKAMAEGIVNLKVGNMRQRWPSLMIPPKILIKPIATNDTIRLSQEILEINTLGVSSSCVDYA